METFGLINFDGIDINQHEYMKNALYNLNNHHYLSYNFINLKWSMNTTTHLWYHACFLASLFPFRIGVPEMVNMPIKMSL
jgi:hypothetical protein